MKPRILLMTSLAQMINVNVYIELGVRNGQTINEMVKYTKRCIGVDIDNGYAHTYDKNIEFYHMSTNDFIQQWTGSIDLLFIDADHNHKSSYEDFLNYKNYITDNGIIILHDTCPCNERMTQKNYCHDTWKTAIKIKENHNDECEIMTIPDDCGLSLVRMHRGKHLIWR